MLCDKMLACGSLVTGVKVKLEWGISDRVSKKRKANTRFLYVYAQSGGCERFTQNWQPEVNELLEQIKMIISPLIVDEPSQDDLRRLPNVPNQWIDKVKLKDALSRA